MSANSDNGVSQTRIRNVIFDIGNVIVAWEPFQALQSFYSTEEECHANLDELNFADWNREQDRGRSWEEGIQAVACPNKAQVFAAYAEGLEAAHSRPVEGTTNLIDKLLKLGHIRVGGCTNASLRTFSIMKQTAPILHRLDSNSESQSSDASTTSSTCSTTSSVGAGIVVSAEETLVKPDPAIFQTCLERFQMVAEETLFVDDSLANCQGAQSVGMKAHQFQTASQLEAALKHYGLLL